MGVGFGLKVLHWPRMDPGVRECNEVILGDDPSKAQWELGVRYSLRERRAEFERYNPDKWKTEGKTPSVDIVGSLLLGAAFGAGTTLVDSFLS